MRLTPEDLEIVERAGRGKARSDEGTDDGELGFGKIGTVVEHDDVNEVRTIEQLLHIRLILRGRGEEIKEERSAIGQAGKEIDFGAVWCGEDGPAGGRGDNKGNELVVAGGLIGKDEESAGAVEGERRSGEATRLSEIESGERYGAEGEYREKSEKDGRECDIEAIETRLRLGLPSRHQNEQRSEGKESQRGKVAKIHRSGVGHLNEAGNGGYG